MLVEFVKPQAVPTFCCPAQVLAVTSKVPLNVVAAPSRKEDNDVERIGVVKSSQGVVGEPQAVTRIRSRIDRDQLVDQVDEIRLEGGGRGTIQPRCGPETHQAQLVAGGVEMVDEL